MAAVTRAMSQYHLMPASCRGLASLWPTPMATPLSSDVHPSCEFHQRSGVRCRHLISGIPEAAVSDLGDEVSRGLRPALGLCVALQGNMDRLSIEKDGCFSEWLGC